MKGGFELERSTLIIFASLAALFIVLISAFDWRRAIKCVVLLALFEGAIRKWILPSASDMVYFAKDGVLLGAYLGVLFKDRINIQSGLPRMPWPIIYICVGVLLLEPLNPNIGSLPCAIMGMRGYLFYLPLVFLMPHIFRSREEMVKQLAILVLISIPICLLGVLQFRSDRFSVINTYASGISQYGASGFGLKGEDLARITGTFSYLSGHVVFVCVFFALNVALLFSERVPYRFYLSFVSPPLLVANALMSGSRAALYVQGLIACGFAITALGTSSYAFRKRAMTFLFVSIVSGAACLALFSDAIAASLYRANYAGDTFLWRTLYMPMQNVASAWAHGGALGCGIGLTSTADHGLRDRLGIRPPVIDPGMYDNELSSVVAELGVIGALAWYTVRFVILIALLRNYSRSRDATTKSLALAATLVSLPFFIMSVVLNHTACVLIWSLCGLGMTQGLASEAPQPRPIRRGLKGRQLPEPALASN